MTDVVFAFGTEGYFFESQTQWRMKDLPYRLQARFASGSTDVAHVHQLVLGAGESWFMSYRTKAGGASFAHDGLPEKLAEWLRVKDANGYSIRNISKLKISLGPYNRSFWAEDGKDYFWDNLPGPLQMALEKLKSPQGGWSRAPKIVALGVNQSYVMISEGGGGSYAVSDYYPWLEKELLALIKSGRPGALKAIHYISIDQHDGQNFVMTTVDGQVYYYVPDSLSAAMAAIRATIPRIPAGYLVGRDAETGSNPMPIPQSVSVPSSGLDNYHLPEEVHAQNIAMASPTTGTHAFQSVQQPASPSPVEYTQAPAPPYVPNQANTVYLNAHRTSISSNQTIPAQHQGQAAQNNFANRVGSPQSLYQNPQVAALEQAAATTRIMSPSPSVSQSQYSHDIPQPSTNGMTQRIMSPVPAEPSAIIAHSSSEVVSPSPGHHQASNSPRPTTTSPNVESGRASAQIPGSPSPMTQTSASPVYGLQNQTMKAPGVQTNGQAGLANVHSIQIVPAQQSMTMPASANGVQVPANPAQPGQMQSNAQIQTFQPPNAITGQSLPLTQPLSPLNQSSPPPVPNPTPVPHNVQFAGSSARSAVGSQISHSSIHAPVPIVHNPGATPSRAESVPVPKFSTPAPNHGPQTQPQLVPVKYQPAPPSQTPAQSGLPTPPSAPSQHILPAEVSASPPPHRQSFASTSSMAPTVQTNPQLLTPTSEDPVGLPGAIPYMPPAKPASPIQPSTSPLSPPMSPALIQPHLVQTAPAPTPQQRVTSPVQQRPQLVQMTSAPTQHVVPVPGQPGLVRIVSAPGQVQPGTLQYVQAPGGQIQVVQQPMMVAASPPPQGQVSQAGSPVPVAVSAAGPSMQTQAQTEQKAEAAEAKKKQAQAGQGRKLASAIGFGVAKGVVRGLLS